MENEFNLSEKIYFDYSWDEDEVDMILIKDVKEFIRKLKEEGCECEAHPKAKETFGQDWVCWFCVLVDRFAGEDLI